MKRSRGNRSNRSSSGSPPEYRSNPFKQCLKESPIWRRGALGTNKLPSPLLLGAQGTNKSQSQLPPLSLLEVKKIQDSHRSSNPSLPPSMRKSHPSSPQSMRMSNPSLPPSMRRSSVLKPTPSHFTLNMASQVKSNQPNNRINELAGLFGKKKLGGSVKIRKQKINKNIKKFINKNKTKKRHLRKYIL